jgi:parallel beta-helix repeat protein
VTTNPSILDKIGGLQPYKRYLPTAFDESLSLLEKVNKVIEIVTELALDNVSDDIIMGILQTWLADGTLASILNDAIMNDQPYVNARVYKTVNNLSDTVTLQTLIDANPYKRIVIEGSWILTEKLTLVQGTILDLQPNAVLTRQHNDYMFTNFLLTDTPTGYNGKGNIKIMGGTLDQNGFNYPSKASCILLGHAKNVVLDGVTIKNGADSHHIELNACQYVDIKNCTFDTINNTVGDFNEAIQLDLAKVSPSPASLDQTPCQYINIRNNYFLNLVRGVGSHASTIGKWHEYINVEDNTFSNLTSWAVRAYSWKRVKIANNRMFNCDGGIIVNPPQTTDTADTLDANNVQTNASQDCQYFIISGNELTGGLAGDGHGIRVAGEATGKLIAVVIENNIVDSTLTNSYSIFVTYAKDVTISDNIVRDGLDDGITVSNSDNVAITGNVVENVGGEGIYVTTNCNVINIDNNVVHLTKDNGIFVRDNTKNISVTGNNIKGVNLRGSASTNHMRFTTTLDRLLIMGNICQDETGTASCRNGNNGFLYEC